MSKINISKLSGLDTVHSNRVANVKTAGTKNVDQAAGKVTGRSEAAGDKVEFSERAAEVEKLIEQVKQLPDIREAKVTELRERIAAADYNPSSEAIADALLKDD